MSEAAGGREGIEAARWERPDLIFCDLYMPGIGAHDIPIVLHTAKSLELERHGAAVLLKDRFSRADAAAEVRRLLVLSGIDT